MSESRKKFDQEFKASAVRIVEESGRPIAEIARDLGVNGGDARELGRESESRADHGGLRPDEREELKQLRADVATLRMERDVLKRSVVLWVKEATK